MNASFDSHLDSGSQAVDRAVFARSALNGVDTAARGAVVSRTHRVVRERAQIMQARRSHVRGLMVPLIICSALLILTGLAVWTGLYQAQAAGAAEAVQADVTALASMDSSNHLVVVLLWFVPVSLAALATVLYRRTRDCAYDEAER